MMFQKCFLVLFCSSVFIISALPSSKESTTQNDDEHVSTKAVTSSLPSTTPSTHPPVANSPIIPQVVYHNQPLNTIPRIKRSVIKFDHRKHHENIYSIASGERGIRYIE